MADEPAPYSIREYLKAIGAKGGSNGKGNAKRRSPEHYAKLAETSRAKAAARKKDAAQSVEKSVACVGDVRKA